MTRQIIQPNRYRSCIVAIFLAFATLMQCAAAASQLTFPRKSRAGVGVVVRDLATGKDVVSENAQKLLTPASILKCVTAAALTLDGKGVRRMRTECNIIGEIDASGTLHGNVIVAGSGDPTLEYPKIEGGANVIDSIVTSLKSLGVRRIAGCVLADTTSLGFKEPGALPKWEVEDLKYGYGAGLYALNYNNNVCNIDRAVTEPVETFIDALEQRLIDNGIDVEWNEYNLDRFATGFVYEHRSPSLKEIMREMMVSSNNLYAEAMLRQLVPGGFRADALERERQVLTGAGLEADDLVAFDGSGLTRNSKVTPQFMADMLTTLAAGSNAADYVSLFPLAGVEGTVKRLLKDTRLEAKLALKSGSMNGVQCFAGYRLDDSGRPTHAVVIMVNDFTCKRMLVMKGITDFLLSVF